MKNLIARFVKDESGATAIEYGLIAAGISLAIIAAVNGLGSTLNTKFNSINSFAEVSGRHKPTSKASVYPGPFLLLLAVNGVSYAYHTSRPGRGEISIRAVHWPKPFTDAKWSAPRWRWRLSFSPAALQAFGGRRCHFPIVHLSTLGSDDFRTSRQQQVAYP